MKNRNTVLTLTNPAITAEVVPPVTQVYENLAVAIANAIAHPDIAANCEMYLCEFIDKIAAAATGRHIPLNPTHFEADSVRENLPSLLTLAHDRVAVEQGLPMVA